MLRLSFEFQGAQRRVSREHDKQPRYNGRPWTAVSPTQGGTVPMSAKIKATKRERETDLHSRGWASSWVAGAARLGGACCCGICSLLALLWLLLLSLSDSLSILLVLVDGPVEDVVVLE